MNKKLYPTRFQKVGNLNCIFLGFYCGGKFPICSIGPDWRLTLPVLICLICILSYISIWLINISGKMPISAGFCLVAILVDLAAILSGVLSDPGVSKKIYKKYSKKKNSISQ